MELLNDLGMIVGMIDFTVAHEYTIDKTRLKRDLIRVCNLTYSFKLNIFAD